MTLLPACTRIMHARNRQAVDSPSSMVPYDLLFELLILISNEYLVPGSLNHADTADRFRRFAFCNLALLAFDFSQFLAIPRLSSEGVCSTPPPADVVQEDEDEEWEPVDRDHVVKFFQVINAQSHTQMVRGTSTHTDIWTIGRLRSMNTSTSTAVSIETHDNATRTCTDSSIPINSTYRHY